MKTFPPPPTVLPSPNLAHGCRGGRISEDQASHALTLGETRQSEGLCVIRHSPSCLEIPPRRLGCYPYAAVRCRTKEGSMRQRQRSGSVVLDKRIKTWNF